MFVNLVYRAAMDERTMGPSEILLSTHTKKEIPKPLHLRFRVYTIANLKCADFFGQTGCKLSVHRRLYVDTVCTDTRLTTGTELACYSNCY